LRCHDARCKLRAEGIVVDLSGDVMGQLPTVFIPSLLGSPRLFADQLPALWRFGPVSIATHYTHDSMSAVAALVLAAAPPRFRLVGLSMGGYLAFEIMRQAADRVAMLALLDTSARPDGVEQAERRREQIALAERGEFARVVDALFERWVRSSRRDDPSLRRVVRQMASDVGAEAFVRQQTAIMNRPDSRPDLAAIGCPTLVVVGAEDEITSPAHAAEIAEGVAGARLVVVPNCGHLSTIEQPGAVTAALVEWLDMPRGRNFE
jgi:pimeloyl-ACP methyl ester carboxylesterase